MMARDSHYPVIHKELFMLSFVALLFIAIGAFGLLLIGSIAGFIQVLLFILAFVGLIRAMEIAKH